VRLPGVAREGETGGRPEAGVPDAGLAAGLGIDGCCIAGVGRVGVGIDGCCIAGVGRVGVGIDGCCIAGVGRVGVRPVSGATEGIWLAGVCPHWPEFGTAAGPRCGVGVATVPAPGVGRRAPGPAGAGGRCARSSEAPAPAAMGMIPPHTEQRARICTSGSLDGSTLKIDRHSGQDTFTIFPRRRHLENPGARMA
jgi:hypothetical protein